MQWPIEKKSGLILLRQKMEKDEFKGQWEPVAKLLAKTK